MTTISHVNVPSVPFMVATPVGIKGAIDFVKDLRALGETIKKIIVHSLSFGLLLPFTAVRNDCLRRFFFRTSEMKKRCLYKNKHMNHHSFY